MAQAVGVDDAMMNNFGGMMQRDNLQRPELKCEATLDRVNNGKCYTLLRIVSDNLNDLIEALKEHAMVDDYGKDLSRIKSEDLQLIRLFKDMKAIQIDPSTGQVSNGEVLTIQITKVGKNRK